MKKETYIAVFLGVGLGIFAAIVMVLKTRESKVEKPLPVPTNAAKETPIAPINTADFQTFEISEPQNNSIVNKNSISIKGKAPKDSLILIQSPIKEVSLKNENDNFSVDMPLVFGENVIRIAVYAKNSQSNSREKELKIYYLDEQ